MMPIPGSSESRLEEGFISETLRTTSLGDQSRVDCQHIELVREYHLPLLWSGPFDSSSYAVRRLERIDSKVFMKSAERRASSTERTTNARPTISTSSSAPASMPRASTASGGRGTDECWSKVVKVFDMRKLYHDCFSSVRPLRLRRVLKCSPARTCAPPHIAESIAELKL